MSSVSSTNLEDPHGTWASSWSWIAAWTTDSNMASSGVTDHSGPSRRSDPETEPFIISASVVAQSESKGIIAQMQGDPTAGRLRRAGMERGTESACV